MREGSLLTAFTLYAVSLVVYVSNVAPWLDELSKLDRWTLTGMLAAKACFWMLVHIKYQLERIAKGESK